MQFDADVIVVGGGLAGVRTVDLLAQSGITSILIEAKDRLGGRTETIQWNGHNFDIGAQWVAPPSLHPRMNNMIERFKLAANQQYTDGKGLLSFFGKQSSYVGEVSQVSGFDKYNEVIKKFDKLMEQVSLDKPWEKTGNPEIDDFPTADQWFDKECQNDHFSKSIFDGSIRCLLGSEPSQLCWKFLLFYFKSGQGYSIHSDTVDAAQHATVVGGTQQISDQMALAALATKKTKILIDSPVTKVTQDKNGVTVYFENSNSKDYPSKRAAKSSGKFRAKLVVITVPPPLAARITFEPKLSPARDMLSQNMKMGAIVKTFMIYDTPFWREKGFSGETFTDDDPVANFYDASMTFDPKRKVWVLIGLIGAKNALNWCNKSPEERKKAVIAQLVNYYGKEAANPVHYIEKNWCDDPYSRGAYMAVMGPGVIEPTGSTLREPIGRLFWAGTETSTEWYGYMEGALASAERVVKELNASTILSPKSKL